MSNLRVPRRLGHRVLGQALSLALAGRLFGESAVSQYHGSDKMHLAFDDLTTIPHEDVADVDYGSGLCASFAHP